MDEPKKYDSGDLIVGLLDCFLALGATLDGLGVMSRAQFAKSLSLVLKQQTDAGATESRTMPVRTLIEYFTDEVIGDPLRRFNVVDGGKSDDEPTE